jgi:myo-inositol-1(or 4)-monophosphatase
MARSALMNVMVGAAMKAARGLKRDFGEVEQLQVSRKGPADFVSAADRWSARVVSRPPSSTTRSPTSCSRRNAAAGRS